MVFWKGENVTLYLVWNELAGGDYLRKVYQKKQEAEFLVEQFKKRGYEKVWIQEISFKKEKLNKLHLENK